jgi:uncharacterized protein (TIGR03663 family)
VGLRLYNLELKPLHHDEGVNGLFVTWLVGPPYIFRYDPANYHGPTLFYFAKLTSYAFGLTTFAIRFVPAFFSILTVLLLFSLRRWIGAIGALAAAALVAVSPGAVYFGRYFIHESLLVCFASAALVAGWEYWRRGRALALMTASAAVALMFATKETAIITAGVMVAAALGTWLVTTIRRRTETTHGWRLAASGSMERPLAANAPAVGSRRITTRGLLLTASALAIFVALNSALYSSFFTYWQGARDALRAFMLWSKTGTQDHLQPSWIYLSWFSQEEAPLFALGIAGLITAVWRARTSFVLFVAIWAFGTFCAYSVIPYKTPWLMLNFIVPLAIVAGWAVNVACSEGSVWPRRGAVLAIVLATAISTYQSVTLNFFRYDDESRPYVYAHTSREILALVKAIDEIGSRAKPGVQLNVAILSPEHFPLSWYLRRYTYGTYGRIVDTNDAFVLASQQQEEELRKQLDGRYVMLGKYALRPGVEIVAYACRDLTD